MKIGYYPGCSLLGSSKEYAESVEAIAPALGLELVEVPDWNCCGASAAHNMNHELAVALPARILALAEKAGLTEILVPCAACFCRLTLARHELLKNEELRKEVSDIIEMDFKGTAIPMNVLAVLNKYVLNDIAKKIIKPFARKVACYYGCLLVRPAQILDFDKVEDPQFMDDIIKKIGGKTIEWGYKTECCGAGLSVSGTNVVAKLSGKIVNAASEQGAEAIIVACPMCHSNLDMRRKGIEKDLQKSFPVPVIYITQAIGLAMGIEESKLGLHRHFVPVVFPVVEKKQAPAEKPAEKKVAGSVVEATVN